MLAIGNKSTTANMEKNQLFGIKFKESHIFICLFDKVVVKKIEKYYFYEHKGL